MTPHYAFAYKLLPRILTQPPQGMDPRLSPSLDDADRMLLGLWRGAAMMVGEEAPVFRPQAARLDVGGRTGLLVYMPATSRAPEATHAAAVPVGDGWRYLTFERPMVEELGPVLGEVEPGDSHVNLGGEPGPATADAFCGRMSALLGVPVVISEPPRTIVYNASFAGPQPSWRAFVPAAIFAVIAALCFAVAWWL